MENDTRSLLQKLSDKALELDAKLDSLKQTAKDASADLNAEYARAETEIEKKRRHVDAKIEELKKSSAEGLAELRAGVDKALYDLGESIDRAKEKFKK